MKTSTLIALSRRLDKTLNEFALAANPAGEYPWQTAQRERMQKRNKQMLTTGMVGGGLATAGYVGGQALKKRYGVNSVGDGMKAGAADLINRADDKLKGGLTKAKTMAGKAAAPVLDPLKRKLAAGKVSYGRGVAQKQGAGKLIARVGRALIHAARADTLVELEAKLDGALQQFGDDMVLRSVIGSQIASAIKAKKGEKWDAYKEQFAHKAKEGIKGGAKGSIPGAVLGGTLAAGMAAGHVNRGRGNAVNLLKKGRGRKAFGKIAGKGALIGAGAGAYAGFLKGTVKGNFDQKSTEIHRKHKA